ncbi:MAG: tail fiber domain-containing protein, partial [Chitinophagales bacterium]|nr:tail fiber domain-containing protein [Chitinophagales bacterium]
QSDMSANNPADLGIGYTCGTPLQAKLDVYNYTNNTASPITPFYTNAYAGRFIHDGNYNDIAGTTDMVGVLVENKVINNIQANLPSTNQSRNIGTHSIASGNIAYNIGSLSEAKGNTLFLSGTGAMGISSGADLQSDGVLGIAYNSRYSIGVQGVSIEGTLSSAPSLSAGTCIGGMFVTYRPQSSALPLMDNDYSFTSLKLKNARIGVYGGVISPVQNPSAPLPSYVGGSGVPLTTFYAGVYGESGGKNAWAGYFNGDIGTTTGVFWTSDSIVKTNVANLSSDSSLHILSRLHPKIYTLDSANYPSLSLNSNPQIGLFAQEVERVIPSAVRVINHPATEDSLGNIVHPAVSVKALNYIELIPVLISAIKSLDSTNKSLQNQINTITAAQTGARSAAASPSNAVAKGTEVHLS